MFLRRITYNSGPFVKEFITSVALVVFEEDEVRRLIKEEFNK